MRKKYFFWCLMLVALSAQSAQAVCLASSEVGCGMSLPNWLGVSAMPSISGISFGWLILGAVFLLIPAFVKMITGGFDLYLSGGNGSAEDNSKGQIKLGIIFLVTAILLGAVFIYGGRSNHSSPNISEPGDNYSNY